MIMSRVNYPLTLEQLERDIKKAIKKYGKDKYVLLASDEEGNEFHECYYSITPTDGFSDMCFPYDLDKKDCVILG